MTLWQRLKNVVGAVWAVFDPRAQEKYAIRCAEMRRLARAAGVGSEHRETIAIELEYLGGYLREHNGPAMAAILEEGARLLRGSH